jgi:hypothetical protein
MLHLGTMAAKKPPLLTPLLTPVAPRRARDRVPSILALGLFLPVSDFTQPENGLPTPPLPFPYTGCHQTASYSPKIAPLHFCTSGSEMLLTEEPGLYKRPCPPLTLTFCGKILGVHPIYESSLRAGHGWRESLYRRPGWFKSF